MKQNMNTVDRLVRLFIAVLFVFFCWVGELNGGLVVACLVIGFYLTVTAILGVCPLYFFLGRNVSVNKQGEHPSAGARKSSAF